MSERREIVVRGIVQGVGFRPFIYSLARRHALAGWVRNDTDGVTIEIEGPTEKLDLFLHKIVTDGPPLAKVEAVSWRPCRARGEREFHIAQSREESGSGESQHALISPDAAVCADCLRELFDPMDRRFRYPFINCTNCGPRFTITRSIPYDRATTTMADFVMCPNCQQEYEDPANRRFHAQPNACPVCGPQAWLVDATAQDEAGSDAIHQAAALLLRGAVIAIKGLGGYHLACNPFAETAVETLRRRKLRQDRPFALMALNVEQARMLCRFGAEEERLLASPARPIVLLERRNDTEIVEAVAPRQKTLGVMLAYTPLHHLLLSDAGIPLVMTSGNCADEPIAYQDEEAFTQLIGMADAFLTHNRMIHIRCDDSVVRVVGGIACPTRRSRGFTPAPLRVARPFDRHILACGGELKNTFCLAKGNHAFLSHHIGDLENYETLRSFREGIEHFCRLFDVQPELIAYDLHPDYLSTQYARELEEGGLPAIGVQHHHAHIAACLADNERPAGEVVIGVALDGTGYGTDGTLWGGEFFIGSIAAGFMRRAHLKSIPLPGGEAAIRQPWRMGVAQLIRLYGEEATLGLSIPLVREAGERNVRLIARLLEHRMNTPLTSSAGRLFDSVAAIIGVPGTQQCTYEGQAAIELELAACGMPIQVYPFRLREGGEQWIIDTDEVLVRVAEEVRKGRSTGEIAAQFHRTLAEMVAAGCERLREASDMGSAAVALSGGTFQNRLLTEQAEALLRRRGFTVYRHRRVPANDGGLCLGQAVLADFADRESGGRKG